jgi:hypothetical protein
MNPTLSLMCLLLGLLFSASGCTSVTSLAKQLKNDPAVVDVDVVTLYGRGRLIRVGNNTNTVTIAPDGTVTINAKK